jgi:peptidoglycan/LPS O-acetylase OafA/YrhL
MREQEVRGSISLKAFYIRRFLRIFPAFYLYLAVIIALTAAGILDISWRQIAGAASYTWNYIGLWHRDGSAHGWWFLGHLWTLSLEEQFYLLWPGLIVLGGWKTARGAVLLIPVLAPLIRVGSYFLFPEQRGMLGMMFHTAIDSVLIGCAFALWEGRLPGWAKSSPVALVAAAVFAFGISPFLAASLRGAYSLTVGFGADALCAGILVLQAHRAGAWKTFLSLQPLPLIGILSYSLYLWQQLFLTNLNVTWTGRWPWNFLAAAGCALASYYLVERPILGLKRRFERAR